MLNYQRLSFIDIWLKDFKLKGYLSCSKKNLNLTHRYFCLGLCQNRLYEYIYHRNICSAKLNLKKEEFQEQFQEQFQSEFRKSSRRIKYDYYFLCIVVDSFWISFQISLASFFYFMFFLTITVICLFFQLQIFNVNNFCITRFFKFHGKYNNKKFNAVNQVSLQSQSPNTIPYFFPFTLTVTYAYFLSSYFVLRGRMH